MTCKTCKRFIALLIGLAVSVLVVADGASAQALPPLSPLASPPPPPAPPPPSLEVPKVPQMDAPLAPPKANLPPRGSFSDRIARCLEDGAALGLGPNERAEYSRVCANQ